jgi:DNA repair photolyase
MLHQKQVTSVLNKQKQRDSWFLVDYTVNPYEGCSCNCLYCYIRGSKYGENMDDGLAVKINALKILEKQLQARARKDQYGIVAVGSATDAYLPHESKLRMTEGMLKLLLKYRFPVFISTKRTLITRDLLLLKQIDTQAILPCDLKETHGRGVTLSVSVSSLNTAITNMLEPGAVPPLSRLQLVRQLKQEGFLVGVNAIPLLPYISDTEEELEKIISAASQYEADYILAGSLTLFGNETASSKTLYYKFLQRHNPDLIRMYDNLYSGNHFPNNTYQLDLKEKVTRLCKKYKIRNTILKS